MERIDQKLFPLVHTIPQQNLTWLKPTIVDVFWGAEIESDNHFLFLILRCQDIARWIPRNGHFWSNSNGHISGVENPNELKSDKTCSVIPSTSVPSKNIYEFFHLAARFQHFSDCIEVPVQNTNWILYWTIGPSFDHWNFTKNGHFEKFTRLYLGNEDWEIKMVDRFCFRAPSLQKKRSRFWIAIIFFWIGGWRNSMSHSFLLSNDISVWTLWPPSM